MNNSEENNIKWIKVVMVLLSELILALFIFYSYPGISMLFLGEGGSSQLYSNGNSVVWALMPVLIPTLINVRHIYNAVEIKNSNKLKLFKLIQLILMVSYLPLVVLGYYLTLGFRI
jgi:hypothetical protein